jgi:gliding motility-associated-like protein
MWLKSISLFTAILFIGTVSAQNIIIDPNPTPASLVTNTLIGPGLVTSNITFTGDLQQIGHFIANGSNIGLDSGVVMTSGYVANIVPPNMPSTTIGGPGDPEVLATAQSVTSNPAAANITSTNDAAVLEFDFVPNGDIVIFEFVFSSEEYLTYVNTVYNDAFGFYITGPNPAGGNYNSQNMAIVPGTTEPITISTIHPGLNSQYYIGTPSGHSFNGFTVPIQIEFNVHCDSTYHFKFAIADCQDGILDTGVFLDGGSFQSVPVDLNLETNIGNSQYGDTVIVEGCGTLADFVFTRPSCQSGDSLWVDVAISGTATNGVDYALLPDSVLFLPDSTNVSIPFSAFQDGIFEGYEDVVLTVTNILPSGDTIITTGIVWLLDQPNVSALAHDTTIVCYEDSVQIMAEGLNGIPPYSFSWQGYPDTLNTLYVPGNPNGSYDYYVTIVDGCGFTDTDTLTLIVNQTLWIDSVASVAASSCNPDGEVMAYPSGETGVPTYEWSGPGANSPNTFNASTWQGVSTGWYYFNVTDDVCYQEDSVFVDIAIAPIASMSPTETTGCNPYTASFINNSQNAVSYDWIFGNGDPTLNTSSTAGQNAVFTSTTTATLVAIDQYGCTDTAYTLVNVVLCGCMDPLAINYDPAAEQDNETCIYPIPEVIIPNVFTPNGDGDNDVFFLETIYTETLELIITNRWGNVVYHDTGSDPAWPGWDGTTKSGGLAAEGVYFCRYIATGVEGAGEPAEGHGFLHLERD